MKERSSTAETPLRRTQRWLASVILKPDRLDDAGFGGDVAEVLVARGADACATAERLRAYTGGYPARIGDSLAESYPALAHVIGGARFHALSERYLPHVPAGIYNLNEVGSLLPTVVAADPIARDFPFAPDLARLEWAVHVAFHAREKGAFDPDSVAGWTLEDWAAAVLELQPSVALVRSQWPIRDIWAARETPIEEIDIELAGRPQCVLVHRSGFKVVCEAISEDEAAALGSLLAGRSLGETSERLSDEGRDASSVAQWFARWSSRRLVAGCSARL